MKRWYRKLVRDRIPQAIEANGDVARFKILEESDFIIELKKKLLEEAAEVMRAKSKSDITTELGDTLDVIDEIRKRENISAAEISASRKAALKRKGGFAKKLLLLWTEDNKRK